MGCSCVCIHVSLLWRHNARDGVSNHQPHDCLVNRLFRRRSKKTSKLRVTGLWKENSPVTGEFPAQRASNAENVSIWWHHHIQLLMGDNPMSCICTLSYDVSMLHFTNYRVNTIRVKRVTVPLKFDCYQCFKCRNNWYPKIPQRMHATKIATEMV